MPHQQLKRKFNKVKRRIELGVDKPGDRDKFVKWSIVLGYKNHLNRITDGNLPTQR